jgi:hypothetical protein
MLGKNIIRKSITSLTAVAVFCVYSMVAYAIPASTAGEITVTGQVTVNGQPAVSGSTIMSGAVITTSDNSSATVNLGRAGRVEVLANSSTSLRFTGDSIVANLTQGKARVSNSAGVSTTITTKNATMMGDVGQANNFTVEVECSHTHVDTASGVITLREGTSDRQVVAGTSAVAGNLAQAGCQPCLRPDSAPGPAIGGWPWLLLAAAGAAAVGIYLAGSDNDTNFGGSTVVVSPTR